MGSYSRVNSIIYWENFEINVPCRWSYNIFLYTTYTFWAIRCIFKTQNLGHLMNADAFSWFMSTSDVF